VAKAIASLGGRTATTLGNQAAVKQMKSDIEAALGEVEILVNCAGGDIGAAGGKPNPNNVLGIPLEDMARRRRNCVR
jgi:NAD(P)-dependent dehydrogenase (short-subunit alcohol dehydrogenase family)